MVQLALQFNPLTIHGFNICKVYIWTLSNLIWLSEYIRMASRAGNTSYLHFLSFTFSLLEMKWSFRSDIDSPELSIISFQIEIDFLWINSRHRWWTSHQNLVMIQKSLLWNRHLFFELISCMKKLQFRVLEKVNEVGAHEI